MRALTLTLALLAGSLPLLGTPGAGSQTQSVAGDPCVDFHRREPVLVRDETGYGFAGQLLHSHLVVYSDGFAAASRSESLSEPAGVATAFVDPALVEALRADLLFAGAASLCDQQVAGADLALSTVSLFHGRDGRRCRTFSYYVPDGGYGAVETRIDAFVAAHLPGSSASK